MAGMGMTYGATGGVAPGPGKNTGRGPEPVKQAPIPLTQAPFAPQAQQPNLTPILNMLQQPGAPTPPVQNTSTPNPIAQNALNVLNTRATTDQGAADAMRLANVGIRDQASGIMQELAGNASRRGVSGGGVGGIQNAKVAAAAMRDMSGSNAKIAYDSERSKDNALTNVNNVALQQDAAQNEQRRLAIQQAEQASNAALQQQRLQQERLTSALGLLSATQSGGLFGPTAPPPGTPMSMNATQVGGGKSIYEGR